MSTHSIENQQIEATTSNFNFEEFFLYDWFLIELGRNFDFDEKHLLKILCLNRKINERAKVSFKPYLFSAAIQNQILQLFDSNQLNDAKQFLERNLYAIQPNFKIAFNETKIKTNLITVASILKWDVLVPLIFFHPRMNLRLVEVEEIAKIFHWAIQTYHLKVVSLIVNKLNYFTIAFEDLAPIILNAIKNKQKELLRILMNWEGVSTDFHSLYKFRHECLETSVEFGGGIEQYELILNCKLIPNISTTFRNFAIFNPIIERALEYGSEYVAAVVNSLIKTDRLDFLFMDLEIPERTQILKSIMENHLENGTEETAKYALIYTYLFRYAPEFHTLLDERKNSIDDQELLNLFLKDSFAPNPKFVNPTSDLTIFKAILKQLSSNAKFVVDSDEKGGNLFWVLIEGTNYESFKLIWNDKRCIHDQQWTNEFARKNDLNTEMVEFLIPFCDLSVEVKVGIQEGYFSTFWKFADEVLETELRNSIWLKSISRKNDCPPLDWLQGKLEIKWTVQFFEWNLRVLRYLEQFVWILENSLIQKDWWNDERIHLILMNSLKKQNTKLLEFVLNQFPNVDKTLNNNQISEFLSETHHFKDEEQQKLFKQILFPKSEI